MWQTLDKNLLRRRNIRQLLHFESGDWVMVFQDEFDDDELNKDIWYTCLDNWNRGVYS